MLTLNCMHDSITCVVLWWSNKTGLHRQLFNFMLCYMAVLLEMQHPIHESYRIFPSIACSARRNASSKKQVYLQSKNKKNYSLILLALILVKNLSPLFLSLLVLIKHVLYIEIESNHGKVILPQTNCLISQIMTQDLRMMKNWLWCPTSITAIYFEITLHKI